MVFLDAQASQEGTVVNDWLTDRHTKTKLSLQSQQSLQSKKKVTKDQISQIF